MVEWIKRQFDSKEEWVTLAVCTFFIACVFGIMMIRGSEGI